MVDGYGSGSGYGSGYGSGSGSGYGSGYGYGSDYGSGYGSGSGSGYGYGSGSGDENECREFLSLIAHLLNGKKVLAEPNAELRRIMIECIGSDKFFHDIEGIAKHEDVDGHGNPRRLVRIPMPDTEAGYLQAVHVVCPSTGREYYLGVMPGIDNCQDAVASTFGLTGQEYQPVRES